MEARFFSDQSAFRKWLQSHHDGADLLWVGYYKKTTGIRSITWPESVDEALCFGWIDGLRKSIDEQTYCIRFTPRRPGSRWSSRNIERAEELIKLKRMTPAGLRAFKARGKDSSIQSRRHADAVLPAPFASKLKSNRRAWEYFNTLAPSLRRMSVGWVMDAKKEETRLRRLDVLIESSENGRKVPPLIISKKLGT